MAFLDFIKNHTASPATPSVEGLSAPVKAQAVEAARPAAQLMEQATTPRATPAQSPPSNSPSRGLSPGR